jgi:hypothetical protein
VWWEKYKGRSERAGKTTYHVVEIWSLVSLGSLIIHNFRLESPANVAHIHSLHFTCRKKSKGKHHTSN